MTSLALWINIIAFAFMASSIGLTAVVRSRRRHAWLDWYLLYAASYTLWAIMYSVHFFLSVYEPDVPMWYRPVTAWTRIVLSGSAALSLPMIVSVIDARPMRARVLRISGFVLASAFLISGLLTRRIVSYRYAALVNVAYNSALFVVSVIGIRVLRSSRGSSARALLLSFFYITALFYFSAVCAGTVMTIIGHGSVLISSFAIAAYCLPWAMVQLGRTSSYLLDGASGAGIPESFGSDYALTPREREVVELVSQGKSNAEISQAHFVSLKTVETHIYNIYRKTGVRNRVELSRLVATYRSGASE